MLFPARFSHETRRFAHSSYCGRPNFVGSTTIGQALGHPMLLLILVAILTSVAPRANSQQSDDFSSGTLDTGLWSFINPVGDGSYSLDGSHIQLSVPAAVDHDLWSSGNDSARITQFINNTDFEIEAKFTTPVSQMYQMQGLLVEQDAGNYIRVDFSYDGSNTEILSVYFVNGVPTSKNEVVVSSGDPMYLRLRRQTNQWTVSFSVDGVTWHVARIFNHALTANTVGVFAGNAGGASAPAHTAVVDYFFNTAAPVIPEDGQTISDSTAPFIRDIQRLAGSNQFTATWETDELATSRIEYGLTTSYELGFVDQGGMHTNHSVTVPGLIAGNDYHFRLRSIDANSNTVYSSDQRITVSNNPFIDVWNGSSQTFGQLGSNAQRFINVLGHVSGPSPISSLVYSLNGGSSRFLSRGADGRRLQKNNDFNVEIEHLDLINGANTLAITATDSSGGQHTEYVTLNYQAGNSWPLPYSIDWSNVSSVEDASQIVDGMWYIENDSVRTGDIGYDRLLNIGDISWTNYEVTVPVTLHGLDPICSDIASNNCNGGPILGLLARWQGHHPSTSQPSSNWIPLGALGAYQWKYNLSKLTTEPALHLIGGQGSSVVKDRSIPLPVDVPHIFKLRADTVGADHQYKFKIWPQGQAEPPQWDLEITQNFAESFGNGSLLLLAHYVDASFGDVTVVPLDGSADTTPPAITNIQVTASDTTATVSWATDEVANSLVNYGTTSGYGQSESATSLVYSHNIDLSGLTPNTLYHYRVQSADGSSNTSNSVDLTFTTSADATSPIISNIQAVVTDTTATISWDTNESADSEVNYGSTAAYGQFEYSANQVSSHSLTLSNLSPGSIYHYQISSSDGNSNTSSSADLTLTTDSEADTTPPIISNVQVAVTENSAIIFWNTDEQADSLVEYGLDSSYGFSTSSATFETSHSLNLGSLTPETVYHYRVTSKDSYNNTASSVDFSFTTAAEGSGSPSGLVSDDFTGALNAGLWTWVDPLGDSTLSTTGTQVAISVPAGTAHDNWTNGRFSPYIMQPANNTDFELDLKIDSSLSAQYQIQGFLIRQDNDNLLRLELHHNGAGTRLYSASFTGGVATKRFDIPLAGPTPPYLRVTRIGDQWTLSYSGDGTNWTTGGTYAHTLVVTNVGLFAGNNGSSPPAHTALIDSFIVDGIPANPGGTDTTAPVISNINVTSTDTTATFTWNTDEPATSLVAHISGSTPLVELSSGTLTTAHSITAEGLPPGTVFLYALFSTDASGNTANSEELLAFATSDTTPPTVSNVQVAVTTTSATITWVSNEPSNSRVNYGETVISENNQANATITINHSITLPSLIPDTQYVFQASSTDTHGNTGTSSQLSFTTDPLPGC